MNTLPFLKNFSVQLPQVYFFNFMNISKPTLESSSHIPFPFVIIFTNNYTNLKKVWHNNCEIIYFKLFPQTYSSFHQQLNKQSKLYYIVEKTVKVHITFSSEIFEEGEKMRAQLIKESQVSVYKTETTFRLERACGVQSRVR